jgi:hypothetical protein
MENQQNPVYAELVALRDGLLEVIEEMEEQEKTIAELSKPDWSLAPVWFMTCVLAYIYGVTLGVYMYSK